MVFLIKQKTSLLLNQKIWNYLHVNNIFIVSLFAYLFHNLFKLVLEHGNVSKKLYI